ncbi:MAG: hypothetical protein WCV93_01095 [Candidatus Shapirobacteria bacterium]|jgi:hypothetical protein
MRNKIILGLIGLLVVGGVVMVAMKVLPGVLEKKTNEAVVVIEWKKANGQYELVINGGERKVTAVSLEGTGAVTKIETETRDGLVGEMGKTIKGGSWRWGAGVLGPADKIETGKQVWARFEVGEGGVKAKGSVVLAKQGDKPAEEIEVEGGI